MINFEISRKFLNKFDRGCGKVKKKENSKTIEFH
jgi:hypothetical protein